MGDAEAVLPSDPHAPIRRTGALLTDSLRNDRRTIFGWAMYDWSNSAFITTQGAIIAPFFTGTIVPEGGWNGWSGETIWAAVVSIGSVVLFLMMPVLGAVADYAAAKRRFLRNFMVVGALLAMVMPSSPLRRSSTSASPR